MRFRNRLLLFPIVLGAAAGFIVLSSSSKEPKAKPESGIYAFVRDSLDIYMERERKAWELPGVAVAIVKDGKIIYSKGFGVRELGKSEMVNDSSLFQIASCSKAFTATALAMLQTEKKISLDTNAHALMPNLKFYDKYAQEQITIRDLLCHRIGLETFQGDFLNWDCNLSRADLVARMERHKPVYGLRSKYGYCNLGFLAAGEAIPLVTQGTSWDDFLEQRFFSPLKMGRTSTRYKSISTDANACVPHSWWKEKVQRIAYDNIDQLGPAGSMSSCVKDLSNWMLMQLDSGRFGGKQVVPFSAIQETRRGHTIVNRFSALYPDMHFSEYGLGWFLADMAGRRVIWHDGGAGGFLSTVCLVPEENLGIVVLTNSDNQSFYTALRYQLLDACFGKPYRNISQIYLARFKKGAAEEAKELAGWHASVKKKNTPVVTSDAFVGTYENAVYGTMNASMSAKGQLTLFFEHHPQINAELEYMQDSTYLCSFNTPVFGIKPATVTIKNKTVQSVTIRVSESLDRMPYVFVKK